MKKFSEIVNEEILQEAEADAKRIIKELVDTNLSGSNEEQGKMAQFIKGLAFSDDPLSNQFMKKLDEACTTIGKSILKD